MSINIEKLRELAKAATPGPWYELPRCDNAEPYRACGVVSEQKAKHGTPISIFKSDAYDECSHPISKADAAYIAALDPHTVIALFDEMERERAAHDAGFANAKRLIAELRDQRAALTAALDEARDEISRRTGRP